MGIRSQFKASMFLLQYRRPSDFYTTHACCSHVLFLLVVRAIFSLYTIGAMITSIIHTTDKYNSARWLVYLTTWNYIYAVIYFLVGFLQTVIYYCKKSTKFDSKHTFSLDTLVNASYGGSRATIADDENTKLSCGEMFHWLMFNIAYAHCTFVVVGYWALLFNPKTTTLGLDTETYLNFDRHGIVLVLILLEYFMNNLPFRLLHFIYPVAAGFTYLIFNVIYYAITDDGVYSLVKWGSETGRTIGGAVLSLVAIAVFHVILFFVDICKRRFCCKPSTSVLA